MHATVWRVDMIRSHFTQTFMTLIFSRQAEGAWKQIILNNPKHIIRNNPKQIIRNNPTCDLYRNTLAGYFLQLITALQLAFKLLLCLHVAVTAYFKMLQLGNMMCSQEPPNFDKK